jgi:accessory gene regulator B
MSLTEKIAVKIGSNAKLILNADEDKEQIIVYGAINLLQIIFSILWVVVFGLILGVFFEALLFSITTGILRKYSGGVHASSPNRCIILGTIITCIAGVFIRYLLYKLSMSTVIWISVAFIIFALIVIIKKAPVDSVKKPITNIELKKQFRNKAIIVILFLTVIIFILFILSKKYSELYCIRLIESIGFGVFWQTVTLTQVGIGLIEKVDYALKYIMEGGGKL